MAIPNVNGFRVKKGNETGITKIATDAILDKAVTKAKLSQPVQTEINKVANKADQDGDYDSLTAGGAKQLLSTVYVDDNEPYSFRTAGGSADIGDRMYEEVVGGSIVWNNLVELGNFPDGTLGWSVNAGTLTVENGVATIEPSAQYGRIYSRQINWTSGHKYLSMLSVKPSVSSVIRVYGASQWAGATKTCAANVWTLHSTVLGATSGGIASICIQDNNASDWGTVQLKNVMLFDLTQMFGSAIADYIYTLEQGTEGAGVAWFRKLFPKPYYEYNAGELMSVKAGSHDTVGFNQFDKSTATDGKAIYYPNTGAEASVSGVSHSDYIKVMPSTTYYTSAYGGANIYVVYMYDGNKDLISPVWTSGSKEAPLGTFTTSDKCCYIIINFYTSIKDNVCLNLAWDGERNGEYEPYEKYTYPLANIELRGIPKLDANNQLYYDGDTYASDGTVTRKYGIVDLGTIDPVIVNWLPDDDGVGWLYSVSSIPVPSIDNYQISKIVCPKFTAVKYNELYNKMALGMAGYNNDSYSLCIRQSDKTLTTVSAVKAAMNGVYLIYEMRVPTTETADTFVNPQVVDDFGTEEYTDYAVEAGDRDVAIPVGHNSQYMNNLRAKLEMAPESPSGDGKYIVQQSNGENAYIPYTADGRLDAIETKLPAPPSANGTYKLTATVTDGGVTYTWVAG